MAKHDYTPSEALSLLLQRIESVSRDLASRMRIAIDAGKEVRVIDDNASKKRGRKSEPRYYRKNAPHTDEEAMLVAIKVLKAHLVEVRFVGPLSAELKKMTKA